MLNTEAIDLIKEILETKKEAQTIEVKSANKGFPKIYDTLSSFSNQNQGGSIVFGIDESKDFELVGTYNGDVQDLQHRISEACKQMEPEVRAVISSVEIDGKSAVIAEIPGVEFDRRPVYYKGAGIMKGSYIRVGDADELMNEYEIYRYKAYHKHIRDDIRPAPEASFEQMNKERLQQYLLALKVNRPNVSTMSDEELISLMNLQKDGVPTLATVMSFSKYPQATFPQLCITAVLVPGTDMGSVTEDGRRFLANKRIEGTIGEMAEAAVNFVAMNMREQVGFDEQARRIDIPEYPLGAVREVILNALVHRDYSTFTEGMPIRIEMYRDRIEIGNPGGIFGLATIDTLGRIQSDTRNRNLISILEMLHVVENRFSGIPTIRRLMAEAGLPAPVFKDEKGVFTVILYNTKPTVDTLPATDARRSLLDFCKKPRSRTEIAEFYQKTQYYVMKKYVEPLVESGLLALTLPNTPKSTKQKYFTVQEK